jgi:hypothetical protein
MASSNNGEPSGRRSLFNTSKVRTTSAEPNSSGERAFTWNNPLYRDDEEETSTSIEHNEDRTSTSDSQNDLPSLNKGRTATLNGHNDLASPVNDPPLPAFTWKNPLFPDNDKETGTSIDRSDSYLPGPSATAEHEEVVHNTWRNLSDRAAEEYVDAKHKANDGHSDTYFDGLFVKQATLSRSTSIAESHADVKKETNSQELDDVLFVKQATLSRSTSIAGSHTNVKRETDSQESAFAKQDGAQALVHPTHQQKSNDNDLTSGLSVKRDVVKQDVVKRGAAEKEVSKRLIAEFLQSPIVYTDAKYKAGDKDSNNGLFFKQNAPPSLSCSTHEDKDEGFYDSLPPVKSDIPKASSYHTRITGNHNKFKNRAVDEDSDYSPVKSDIPKARSHHTRTTDHNNVKNRAVDKDSDSDYSLFVKQDASRSGSRSMHKAVDERSDSGLFVKQDAPRSLSREVKDEGSHDGLFVKQDANRSVSRSTHEAKGEDSDDGLFVRQDANRALSQSTNEAMDEDSNDGLLVKQNTSKAIFRSTSGAVDHADSGLFNTQPIGANKRKAPVPAPAPALARSATQKKKKVRIR